jgi:NTP pyrophosphatase (non-canonical NTP hydrolase)
MEEIIKQIIKFRDDRDWGKFHNPKDLSISLSLEASELLENFQWKDNDAALQNIDHIKEELADVFIYSILLSHELNIDVKQIIIDKLKKNNEKYPIEKAFGSNKKYTEL